jgi:hypothetical protein
MHLVVGKWKCSWNIPRKTPYRRVPVDHILQHMGTFHGMQWDFGCPCSVHNVQMKEQILEVTKRQPIVSTGHLAARTGTSHTSVHHTLQEQQLYAVTFSLCKS